jgi:hypothetical protein
MKKNDDITIEGKKVTIKGSGDVIIKGQKVLQNRSYCGGCRGADRGSHRQPLRYRRRSRTVRGFRRNPAGQPMRAMVTARYTGVIPVSMSFRSTTMRQSSGDTNRWRLNAEHKCGPLADPATPHWPRQSVRLPELKNNKCQVRSRILATP